MSGQRLAGPSILAIVADMSGPSLWRCLQPVTALQRTGYPCGWDRRDAAGIGDVAPLFDGYLLPRISWPASARPIAVDWFRRVHAAGKFVVFDADDDLFTEELDRRSVAMGWATKSLAELDADRAERVWAMQQCDGVTVSTQRLATVVRGFTDKPVIVVANSIDIPWFRRVLRSATRTVPSPSIGWAGGRRPDADVAEMAEAWGRIAARYPDVRFVVQGYVPPVIRQHVPAERLHIIPWLPLERYPAGLVEVDVACCSVAPDRFNACKSTIKVMEASVAGSAVVASRFLYGKLIDDGETGYLAESVAEWEWALASLVERPAQRSMLARRLLKHVERQHALGVNLHKWPEAWEAIQADARVRRGRLVAV